MTSGVIYNQRVPSSMSDTFVWIQSGIYRTASYLTDPVCKAREYSVRLAVLQDLQESSPRIRGCLEKIAEYSGGSFLCTQQWEQWIEGWYLTVAMTTFAILTPFTAPVGIALRALMSRLSSEPMHYRGSFVEKEREKEGFNHLFRNICGVKGGYDIQEGAQMPIRDDLNYPEQDRLQRLIEQFRLVDPDVLCLCEVFDINDAHFLAENLQSRYAHFVFQCGPCGVGVSSGLFFASKFAVADIQFTPFPKEMLVGTAKNCEKGVLLVDVLDQKGVISTVVLTHGQSSDQVRHPTAEEKEARSKELKFILDLVKDKQRVVFTGDLNLDDAEMLEEPNHEFYEQFSKTTQYFLPGNSQELFTWSGDEWYVGLGNRPAHFSLFPAGDRSQQRLVSTGCNLDHTMVKGEHMKVTTVLLEDPHPYDPTKLSRQSLSDHAGLLSDIFFRKKTQAL